MTWRRVPEAEIPGVLDALREGRCVVCYQPFDGDGCYCPDCDDDGEEP